MNQITLFVIQLACSIGYGVYAGLTMQSPLKQVRYWVILLSINSIVIIGSHFL